MYDRAILGAGPAGLSAGIEARKENLSVIIIDEFMEEECRRLGQLYQIASGKWWNGIVESIKL